MWRETETCWTVWRTEHGHEDLVGVASTMASAARMLADRLAIQTGAVLEACAAFSKKEVDPSNKAG